MPLLFFNSTSLYNSDTLLSTAMGSKDLTFAYSLYHNPQGSPLISGRIGSPSMLTLFTRTPSPKGVNKHLWDEYGYIKEESGKSAKVLHCSLSTTRFTPISDTGRSLKITCDDKIYIESDEGLEDAYWEYKDLEKVFNKKFKNKLVYVKAYSWGYGLSEEFYFAEAYLIDNLDSSRVFELIKTGDIMVDIRIGQYCSGVNKGKYHDHGTAFRLKNQDKLFQGEMRIDL